MPKTLAEWSLQSGILIETMQTPLHRERGDHATYVVIDHYNPHRVLLWRLSDYKVSSVAGVVIWLVPVMEKVENA